ncbi:MAG TPA: serine hydrolase domain-containing protein, partial [Gemmatimonadales bacterium]|nr:serine hydrolase domain-containing protein [Gemmatimonadales bacterium]
SVAIVRGDSILLARGFGFANLEHRVPATDSTVYQSGSLGKQFTATVVGMLAQQGRLSLNERITRWFPEGRGAWDSVTVRHLLTHTSGVPDYTDSMIDLRKDYTEEQLVRIAAKQRLDFAAGTGWSYSNTGYLLLGVIVHRVTGRFYGDVLQELLFKPLGMGTRVISEADIVPNRAAGYRLVDDQVKNQEWVSPSLNTTADGALYLTVNDLAKWAIALKQRRVPPVSVLDQAWTPVQLADGGMFPYGYGWDLEPQRNHRRIGHTGSWQGFKTAIYHYPDLDLSVAVLANLAEATPGPIAQGIAGILEPSLRPPQLFNQAIGGPSPPVAISALLRRIVAGNETGLTPGARRHLVSAAKRRLPEILKQAKSWAALGCERPTGGPMRWLGAEAVHVCYARGTGAARERTIVTGYFTGDWQVAYFHLENY